MRTEPAGTVFGRKGKVDNMLIDLPRTYYRTDQTGYSYVKVENGVLTIKGNWDFEKLMVELTYALKGTRCHYCHRELFPNKLTIDHLFPTDFGGVTIPNNLEPACSKCNGSKSNMNEYEYRIWRSLGDPERRKEFYLKTIERKKSRKFNSKDKKGFDLPRRWIMKVNRKSIKCYYRIRNQGSRKYSRTMQFAKKYRKLPRPIILSSNYIILDGFTAYAIARELNFKIVPVIILDNVVLLK